MLHGSTTTGLTELRTSRMSFDIAEYGDISGVYAEPDSVRPLYFATIDRSCMYMFSNAWFDRLDKQGNLTTFYYLAIDSGSTWQDYRTSGSVYVIPGETFTWETAGAYDIWPGEWVSRVPVSTIAEVPVEPADLPLPIRGMEERYGKWNVDLCGYPFLDDAQIYPLSPPPVARM